MAIIAGRVERAAMSDLARQVASHKNWTGNPETH